MGWSGGHDTLDARNKTHKLNTGIELSSNGQYNISNVSPHSIMF